tara:strand:- start:176 stop:481 length:306 start_codon:yes stop_codon:yes gene_type:complete
MLKNTLLILLFLLGPHLPAQDLEDPPNLGLAMSATGASLCVLGATMKPTVVRQYNSVYGYNYINIPSPQRKRTQVTTLICGATFTLVGIIIQNIKRKRNGK